MKILLLFIVAFIVVQNAAMANPPSFDCGKASAPIEILICGDHDLKFIDGFLAEAYKIRMKALGPEAANALKENQQLWLRRREQDCAIPSRGQPLSADKRDSQETCLLELYQKRNRILFSLLTLNQNPSVNEVLENLASAEVNEDISRCSINKDIDLAGYEKIAEDIKNMDNTVFRTIPKYLRVEEDVRKYSVNDVAQVRRAPSMNSYVLSQRGGGLAGLDAHYDVRSSCRVLDNDGNWWIASKDYTGMIEYILLSDVHFF